MPIIYNNDEINAMVSQGLTNKHYKEAEVSLIKTCALPIIQNYLGYSVNANEDTLKAGELTILPLVGDDDFLNKIRNKIKVAQNESLDAILERVANAQESYKPLSSLLGVDQSNGISANVYLSVIYGTQNSTSSLSQQENENTNTFITEFKKNSLEFTNDFERLNTESEFIINKLNEQLKNIDTELLSAIKKNVSQLKKTINTLNPNYLDVIIGVKSKLDGFIEQEVKKTISQKNNLILNHNNSVDKQVKEFQEKIKQLNNLAEAIEHQAINPEESAILGNNANNLRILKNDEITTSTSRNQIKPINTVHAINDSVEIDTKNDGIHESNNSNYFLSLLAHKYTKILCLIILTAAALLISSLLLYPALPAALTTVVVFLTSLISTNTLLGISFGIGTAAAGVLAISQYKEPINPFRVFFVGKEGQGEKNENSIDETTSLII